MNTGLRSLVPTAARRQLRQTVEEARYRVWRLGRRRDPVLVAPIFMIGCPRSGTSISVDLFGEHPLVANWSEAAEIWDPRRALDPDADHHWGARDMTPEDARRLHARFEWFRQSHGKARFVNKHPRSSVRIDYIRAVFPDAFFIHVIRDGRAVVSSILGKIRREPYRQAIPFGDFCKPPDWRLHLRADPAEQAAIQWREIVNHVLGRKAVLGDHYHEFTYERMCEDTRGVLAEAFEVTGLPASPAELSRIPARLENRNDRGIAALDTEQLATVERVQEDLLRQLGYTG